MTGTRCTILFVATDLSTGGGVNKVIRDLAVLLGGRLTADVALINARSNQPSSYDFPPEIAVRSNRRQSLLAYFLFLCGLRRDRPDVVVSSWTQDNILVTLAFLFSATRVILVEHSSWHFHGTLVRLLRWLVYPLAWRVIVLNRRDLAHYRSHLSNVRLIPDPVASPSPSPPRRREKLILAIGHLTRLKNFSDAIRAMAKSRLEDTGWSLAIIGAGEEEQALRALIKELGLKRTRIRPPETDLSSWYSRASLLVVPSRRESFSLVLAEAMAYGVIPVAYDSDGPAFILEQFPDHLIAMGDICGLAQSLARFAEMPDAARVRRALQTSVEERFSPDAIAQQWVNLLS